MKYFSIISLVLLAFLSRNLQAAEPSAIKPTHQSAAEAWEPVVLGPRQGGVILLPDGKLLRFTTKGLGDKRFQNFVVTSADGGATWSEPEFAYEGPPASLPLRDADGELHVFPMQVRLEDPEARKQIAINYFIDIWHVRSRNGGTTWDKPKVIFEGYVGSINNVLQLSNGRIILPFAAWIGGRPTGPPNGANEVTCMYSDDGGDSWQQSPSRLTAPCYTDFNGSGYGACEPVLLELKDRSVFMLARTETGRLYQSHSPDGVHWEPLTPSPFLSTDAPAGLLRLPDDRILMFWNSCEKPLRVDGSDGVYGGRDALHCAISSDDGKTWQGFREIYRDPTRNNSPPQSGDRGTAYPMPYLGPNNKVIVMAGQGRAGATVAFDPNWLLATEDSDDFSAGLDRWSVFKHFGQAKRWWRDRVQGPELVDHPDIADKKVLHIRRPDDKSPDGAVWNFPMSRSGQLTLRVRLNKDFQGASISLNDRFFNPTDPQAIEQAAVVLPIQSDGHISIANKLDLDRWHTLAFRWDLDQNTCVLTIDDQKKIYLKPTYRDLPGINYVQIRSTATEIDTAGMYLDSVDVKIDPTAANP